MTSPSSTSGLGRNSRNGFSLTELLTVIAVMVLVIGMSLPLISGMREASQLNQAVLEISGIVEQANVHASANNTHVWIGFHEDTAKRRVTVAAVEGITGVASDISQQATYRPINALKHYDNLRLAAVTGLAGMPVADEIDDSTLPSFSVGAGGRALTFDRVIGFTPSGSVRVHPQQISRWIQIGLTPTQGASSNTNNTAAIQVGGLTGSVRIFRP